MSESKTVTEAKPEVKNEKYKPALPKGIPVIKVQLHQSFTFAGMTETSLNTKLNTGMPVQKRDKIVEMVWTPDGIFGIYKDEKFIIPLANVIAVFY